MFDFDSLELDIKGGATDAKPSPGKAPQKPQQQPLPRPAPAKEAKREAKKEAADARPRVSSLPEGRLPKGHRGTDAPDWEAEAPFGWWRVINEQGGWSGPQFNFHRRGEVLAASAIMEVPYYGEGAFTVRLRDGTGGEDMLAEGKMPRPNGELCDWGKVLELLPTGCDPPSLEVREAHARVVEERHAMLSRVRAEETKQASVSAAFTAGSPTSAHASGAARSLLLRAMGDLEYEDFERRFLRDGYFVVDNALLGGTDAFLEDMMRLDSIDSLTNNIAAKQEVGPWSKRLARRTLWVDEELAKVRYDAPAVAETISLLKGLAHALNPALSRHHVACASRGDPAYQHPLTAPATPNAVLTVPPDVMVALYPGGGAKLAPHFDNMYDSRRGKRLNARELTAIIYANPSDWDAERDGGALVLYPRSAEEGRSCEPVHVDPRGGRLVVFFSCCRHEVLPCFRTRRALQLWIWRPDDVAAGGEGEGGRR